MRPPTLFLAIPLAALSAAVVFGVAALAGDPVRKAAGLSLEEDPPDQSLRLSEASGGSGARFAERGSGLGTVPWDMTVGELLALYHLDNNASARAALETQLGVAEGTDALERGQAFTFALTAREDVR